MLSLGVAGAGASAHVRVERESLRTRLLSADCAVLVEIRGPLAHWSAEDGSARTEYYRVRVLETLKGEPGARTLDVLPRAEGLVRYRAGDRALLFLERTRSHSAWSALAERFPFATTQRPGEEWVLRDDERAPVVAHARRLLAQPATAANRRAQLLAALDGPSSLLWQDTITELMAAHDDHALLAEPLHVAPFAERVHDPRLPQRIRLALLRLLHGHGGYDGDAVLLALARAERDPAALQSLVRLAGASTQPALAAWLAGLLASPDPALRLLAARHLARSWHRPYAAQLAALVRQDEPLLARAALQSLAAMGGETARAALTAARDLEDRKLRTVASAGLRRLDAREARGPR